MRKENKLLIGVVAAAVAGVELDRQVQPYLPSAREHIRSVYEQKAYNCTVPAERSQCELIFDQEALHYARRGR